MFSPRLLVKFEELIRSYWPRLRTCDERDFLAAETDENFTFPHPIIHTSGSTTLSKLVMKNAVPMMGEFPSLKALIIGGTIAID